MEGMIESSIALLEDAKQQLPPKAFEKCHGVVILESAQVGFLLSAQMGTGILLRHDKAHKKWSAPLAVGMTGIGFGLAGGLEKKHAIILLTDAHMTQAMASDFSIRTGFQSGLSVFGMGKEADMTAHLGSAGATLTKTQHTSSVGVYAGIEADVATLNPRTAVNEKFYGKKLTPKEIVFGQVEDISMPVCEPLDRLYQKLTELEKGSKK